MKKMFLGVSMILACLIFLVSPATAATVSHSVPTLSDFLASLAPAPMDAAKRPAIGQEKSVCFAAASCGSYNITCSGNQSVTSCSSADRSCPGERGHVTCDGVTTWCNEPCFDCDALEQDCSWSCNPCSYNFSCDPVTQDWTCHCILRGCPQ